MNSSHFSLPVLYSSAHSDLEDGNEYSDSNDQEVPQTFFLPIPDIPFRRKLIKEELKKFTDVISDQKMEINNQLLLLEEVQNQALISITNRAKLFYEIIQLDKAIKKSKKNVDVSLKVKLRDQAQHCNQNIRIANEENNKISQLIKENQKLSAQLEARAKNLIKDHDILMNQFLNTVSYEVKRQIRSLNDKIDMQERRVHSVSEQYEQRIHEKDQLIADLRAQLFEAQKQTSNYVITKRERLKRPSMIIRDNTNILHTQDKQNDQAEKTENTNDQNQAKRKRNKHKENDNNNDNDDDSQNEKEDSSKKPNGRYDSDEYNNSYNYSESKSEKSDADSDN